MKFKVDYIQLFPKKWLRHRKSLTRLMKKVEREETKEGTEIGIIFGFGDHYKKEAKGKPTYYICTSNDETKAMEFMFYANRHHHRITNRIAAGLKIIGLLKEDKK